MKKRYIFLIVSLMVVGSITYYLDGQKKENEFILETERELDSLNKERDSVFYFADEVLNHLDEQKKKDKMKLSNLDDMVKTKQITIEQQVNELKRLVEESNKMKSLAESEKEKAIKVERMAKEQQMIAEQQRMKAQMVLDSVLSDNKRFLDLNKKLTKEIVSLEKEVLKLEKFILENSKKSYVEEGLDEETNKKKKRKGGN